MQVPFTRADVLESMASGMRSDSAEQRRCFEEVLRQLTAVALTVPREAQVHKSRLHERSSFPPVSLRGALLMLLESVALSMAACCDPECGVC